VKFSSNQFSQASGSEDGLTYAHNRYGRYTRRRATPVNPRSSAQNNVRNSFTTTASGWSGLSGSARAAWETYAANVPYTDKLGASINLTGNAMYVACNQPRIAFLGGTNVVNTAPTTFNKVPLSTPTVNVTTGSNAAVTPIISDGWAADTNNAMIVFASRQKGPGVNFFVGPYRQCGIVRGTGVANITLPFAATAGNKVFFAFRVLGLDGRISDLIRTSDVF
jgi:hypothetical protein